MAALPFFHFFICNSRLDLIQRAVTLLAGLNYLQGLLMIELSRPS